MAFLRDAFDGELINDEVWRVEDLIEELMWSDERVVDQVVKNELLRLKQPPRVDVVEVHRVFVFASDLTCPVFPARQTCTDTPSFRV